jgi:hypothetical protein
MSFAVAHQILQVAWDLAAPFWPRAPKPVWNIAIRQICLALRGFQNEFDCMVEVEALHRSLR